MLLTGKDKYSGKTPHRHFPITNPTWTDLELNPGFRGERYVLGTKCYKVDEVKEDEMGGTEEKCIQCVGGEIKRKETAWQAEA